MLSGFAMKGGASMGGEAVIFWSGQCRGSTNSSGDHHIVHQSDQKLEAVQTYATVRLKDLENIVQKLQNDLKVYTNRGTPHQRLAQGPSQ